MDDKGFWDANGNWKESAPSEGTAAVAESRPETMKVINGAKPFVRETEETRRLKEKYQTIGPLTILYAVFYALCMYKNASGITFPFFVAGSLGYFGYILKKLELTWKSGNAFYVVSTMLLAISTFCTDDVRIIFFNKTGIFLLMICFLLTQFFNTKEWGLGKFVGSIVRSIFESLGELPRPIEDMKGFTKKGQSEATRRVIYVLLGLLITVPLFIIVATLLSSADYFFRQITDGILRAINFSNVFGVIFRVIFWYFAVYMLVSFLCKKNITEAVKDHRTGEPILAITVTSMLSVMYLIFSGIQVMGLFLGQLKLPEGYTYAEYAREGFFQLLTVAILNLVIVLLCMAFFRESKVLKAVLTIMSLCTFIMIASSAMRMILYVQVYNLTFLRILVLWALAVLFLLFVGVVIQIFRKDFPLFRYGMTVVTILYIGLAFSHPDWIIAKYNIVNHDGSLDYHYLAQLSADAAPALIPYLKEHGYDMSVVQIPKEAKEQDNIDGRGGREDPYWAKVEAMWGGYSRSAMQADAFGYYYLANLREEFLDMGIRNFNLSRYVAFRAATK